MSTRDPKQPSNPTRNGDGAGGGSTERAPGRHGGVPHEELEELFLEVGEGETEGQFPEEITANGGPVGVSQPSSVAPAGGGVASPAALDIEAPPPPMGLDEDELFGAAAEAPPPAPRRTGERRAPVVPVPSPTVPSLSMAGDMMEIGPDDPELVTEEMLDEVADEVAVEQAPPPPPVPAAPQQQPRNLPIQPQPTLIGVAAWSGPSTEPALPVAPPPVPRSPLNDHDVFRRESQVLARAREWQKLAAVTQSSVDHGTWVTLPETRAALLLDLARIHRDRLNDPVGAEIAFKRLAQLDPTNEDALDYLQRAYRGRGDWRAVYDLYSAAVEPTWDPNQRLEWTRETAQIAAEQLRSPDLAIEAWERLDRLGDAAEESYQALSAMYRRARRWDRLAQFLGKHAAQRQGAERVLALREVAEAWLSGLRDHEHAGEVLEQILAARPDDILALLGYVRVVARRGDWPALGELAQRSLPGVPRPVVLDFRRVVAEALWGAGQCDEALEAYQRVLELDPDDAEAISAMERFLSDDGARSGELVDFLVGRARREELGDETRARLLERAAELAETHLDDTRRAVELWERRTRLPAGRLAAHRALERLYDRLGDLPGVARSLDGQLALTRNLGARVELLRRLGEHAAHRMGDDTSAEDCWREIITIVPDDKGAHDELLALHRRRGDFEALDRALHGRALRTSDKQEVLGFWRLAAQNIDDNLADPRRSVAAWNRVLDLAPHDEAALAASVAHHRVLGDRRNLIRALEAQLRATVDPAARRERGLEVAALWEESGARVAALAAYERVLRWDPTEEKALAGLARLHVGAHVEVGERGSIAGALEVAAAAHGARGEAAARIRLLRQALALAGDGDKLAGFHGLRRVLWLSGRDETVLAEVDQAGEAAGAWAELAGVYHAMASEAADAAARTRYHHTLARLYEQRLGDPVRAYVVLQSSGLRPVSSDEVAELSRLADATGRHEDLAALLEASAGAEAQPEGRRAMLRRRMDILEKRLGDARRAFAECARLLRLDPHDEQALADARRIAAESGLWRDLDVLHAERWDRAATDAERAQVALERSEILAAHLNDNGGALDQLMVAFRLHPGLPGLADRLRAAAAAGRAWDRVLPLLEARERAASAEASVDELVRLGGLHEHERKDAERAFDLYAEAFALRPDSGEVDEAVRRIAEVTGAFSALAGSWRVAAARAGAPERKLELLRRVATLSTERLQDKQGALEAHHAILELEPGALASLEVVIAHLRGAGEWRELRERLQQWINHAPPEDQAGRVSRYLEIARISRDQLDDLEGALVASEHVLEIDAQHAEALASVRSLDGRTEDPRFELRRLRIELARAEGPRRVELQLACARIERSQLDDPRAAVTTLQQLVNETGADGPGGAPLASLLREIGDWEALGELMEAGADQLVDPAARVAALEQAVAVYEQHLPDAPLGRKEALFRRLLTERPDDAETRRRLLALYRDAGRYDELSTALRGAVRAPGLAPEERRQFESELARVLALALGRDADAAELLGARRGADAEGEGEALLARARSAWKKDDFSGWLEARQQHARKLHPTLGALVLCHLAEACDDRPQQQHRVAGLYREARALDPHNAMAMEALKAIGRRAKGWRSAAALLPDADEARLSFADRSKRLAALGVRALAERASGEATPDTGRGHDFLLRAVAVDPDHYAAWDVLAELRAASGDPIGALEARGASLAAYERSVTPSPTESRDHVARIEALAVACRAAGQDERAAQLSLQAHRLAPTYAASALAVADRHLDAGDVPAAYALYERVLSPPTAGTLTDAERLHATYRRGALALRLGRGADAVADLQAALSIDPLHPGVLRALGAALDAAGRVGAAAAHYIQALLVEPDASRRSSLYARLGRLLEDKLASGEEAGVCYDLSIAASSATPGGELGDREVLSRALAHYRRQGRPERALAVIERILPTVEDSREQAALWTERGSILGTVGNEEKAMEAFDMALSYDPGNRGAINGLSRILERRGDWEQLSQIFEARTESGSPEERAEAMRALARMSLVHLKDPARAEKYLRSAVELAPTREDYEQLLHIYGDDPAQREGRMLVLSGLLGFGGPYMPRVIELGKALATQGDRRWAWCVLSPLMNSTLSEPQLKATVLELRKEFEKSDNTGVLTPHTHQRARTPGIPGELAQVVAELDELVNLGRTKPDEAGATGIGRLDERTAVGKNFAGVAARLGLEGTLLTRAQELPEPYAILDGDKGHVVVRAELLQLLSVAETAFLFASLLEQTRTGIRLLASLRPEERLQLVPALYAACDLAPAPSEGSGAERLHRAIREQVPAERLTEWAARLRDHVRDPESDSVALYQGQLEVSRRVGLVGAADLRFAARVITRLDDSLPKMQTVGRIDDLDEFIAGAPPVRALLGFAVSPLFGRLLHGEE